MRSIPSIPPLVILSQFRFHCVRYLRFFIFRPAQCHSVSFRSSVLSLAFFTWSRLIGEERFSAVKRHGRFSVIPFVSLT